MLAGTAPANFRFNKDLTAKAIASAKALSGVWLANGE